MIRINDALTFPNLPTVDRWPSYQTVLIQSEAELCEGYYITNKQVIEIEKKTQSQSENPEWTALRKYRITASTDFKKIYSRRGDHEKLASDLLNKRRDILTPEMRRGLEMEETAASAYYHEKPVNLYKSGIVINPGFPYLDVSPDYKVYDPSANEHLGLLEIKCPDKHSVADVPYLKKQPDGTFKLNRHSAYYTQCFRANGFIRSSMD